MSDLKSTLEKKKAKLQAIREERERRRREMETKDAEEASLLSVHIKKEKSEEVDEMLSSLGISSVSDVLSSYSSVSSSETLEHNCNNTTPETSLARTTQIYTPIRKKPQFSVVRLPPTSIPPCEIVTYTKQTQTTAATNERDVLKYDSPLAEDEEGSQPHLEGFDSKPPPGILPHGLPQVKEMEPAVTHLEQAAKKEPPKTVRELSEEEKQMIVLTEDFQRFVHRTGPIVERALAEDVDTYKDYTGATDREDTGGEKQSCKLSLSRCFSDERWPRNRCVTSLDWSPQHPELLLAGYHTNAESPHDPDGVCLVWNTKFKKNTPEFIFHCQSAVMSATFARFHPNLILGGTVSGKVVLWDNRLQKRTPVQRTPLSANAHTHPVYCLGVVGTQNAHNLISVSTDGRLCSWSLDMLSQPQQTLELQHRQGQPVAASCLAFPHNDVNNFVVGSQEGAVYSACRHGSKAGVTAMYEGHQAPVTGIDTHKVQGGTDLSHFFLTSSFDWTVKLWNLKENKPLCSFEENIDNVYDVAWSPTHPALFAAVDGTGRLNLWNLNNDTEVPTATAIVEGSPALSQVSWTPSGSQVTCGDDKGRIWLYDVGERLWQPRMDDWSNMLVTLQDMKNNQAYEIWENRP